MSVCCCCESSEFNFLCSEDILSGSTHIYIVDYDDDKANVDHEMNEIESVVYNDENDSVDENTFYNDSHYFSSDSDADYVSSNDEQQVTVSDSDPELLSSLRQWYVKNNF